MAGERFPHRVESDKRIIFEIAFEGERFFLDDQNTRLRIVPDAEGIYDHFLHQASPNREMTFAALNPDLNASWAALGYPIDQLEQLDEPGIKHVSSVGLWLLSQSLPEA